MAFYNELTKFSNRTALIEENREISYEALQEQIDILKRNIEKRSLAFCLCNNTIEAVTGYLAFLQSGSAIALLSASLAKELFNELVANYEPEYIWAPEGYTDGIRLYSTNGFELIKTTYAEPPVLFKDLALLLTTSGSTGSPKLVRQSYNNIQSNAEAIANYLSIEPTDRAITTLPMHYTYGLSIIHSHLLMGASIILTERTLMEKEFWKILREKEATTFGGVPYTYEMLKRLRFFNMDLPSLRYLTQAGGKLSKELHLEFAQGCRDKGMSFIVMYGQVEATARLSYLPANMAVEKAGSIGIPIPGGEFSLIDDNGETICSQNTAGELMYRGANVTLGYATCKEDLALGDERNGVLLTGDIAMRDSEGYYYIVGRKKRFLKMFGNRVNLDEVEGLLRKKGIIAACVGEDDHMRIYTTSSDTRAVHKLVSDITGINQSAFSVVYIEEIPRNEAGKILYSVLG